MVLTEAFFYARARKTYTTHGKIKQKFVVTHTIRESENPALLDTAALQAHFCHKSRTHRIMCFSLYFRKNMTCYGAVKFFLSPAKLCIGGLRQIGVS